MQVLLDQGTPAPLRRFLPDHDVVTVAERGWQTLQNGELLSRAEAAGFQVFVTTDQNLKYQQNLDGRRIAIVVLLTTSWPRIEAAANLVVATVANAVPGSDSDVPIP
jgi:hypothetical protein